MAFMKVLKKMNQIKYIYRHLNIFTKNTCWHTIDLEVIGFLLMLEVILKRSATPQ